MKALHINSTLPFQGAEFFIEDPSIKNLVAATLEAQFAKVRIALGNAIEKESKR